MDRPRDPVKRRGRATDMESTSTRGREGEQQGRRMVLHRMGIGGAALALWMVALTGASLAGCGEVDRPDVGPAVTDSAGITIVTSPDPLGGPGGVRGEEIRQWRIAPEPSASIGTAQGQDPYLFSNITGAVFLPDGRIAVTDLAAREVRLFDRQGRFLDAWGRAGQGPGEFGLPLTGVFPYRGDSIAVVEMVGRQISIFDREGRFGRRIGPRYGFQLASGEVPAQSCCTVVGPLPDGSWLAEHPEVASAGGSGERRGRVRVVRLSPEGDPAGELGVFEGGIWRDTPREMPSPVSRVPLGPGLRIALAGDRVLIGDGVELEVDELDPGGRRIRSVRIDRAAPLLDPDARAAYEEGTRRSFAEAYGEDDPSSAVILRFRFANFPARLPAYERILTDPAGRAWLFPTRVPHAPWEEARALVLAPDGGVAATVELAPGVRILDLGDDAVLGVTVDDLGVLRIVIHPIVKPGEGDGG